MPSSNARRAKRHEREIVHAAENADVVVTRADREKNLCVVPLDLFLDLLQRDT